MNWTWHETGRLLNDFVDESGLERDIAAHGAPPAHTRAETHYGQARALAEALGMRPLVAHCHRSLGTLYSTRGQREQARAALSTAMEMYRTMEMTFWLPQVAAVLAQVE